MTEQQKSVPDLESDIAKSRERLAATIDELAFRAQPKNIVAEQKRQLRKTLSDRYHTFMGTTPAGTTQRTTTDPVTGQRVTVYGGTGANGSKVDQVKAKAEDLKAQAQSKAEELKAQAEAKAEELRSTATAKVDELRGDSRGQHSATGTYSTGASHTATDSSASPLADLRTRAQVKADQARLKLDEATHDSDGELRADRVATGLAAAGAALIAAGVARRNRG